MNAKKEIKAEELVRKITWQTLQDGEFSLNNAIIRGKLDLRHRVISVAVTLTNCIFTDEVDLRYCEFKQCMDFSGSRFKKDFNSGDEANSFTIYRKDLICNETIFEGGASFNGAQCEGSGYFNNARFENSEKEIIFAWAIFGTTLECQRTIFKGDVIFTDLECERHVLFKSTIFKGGASFNNLQCEGGFFQKAQFENPDKNIDFGYARFSRTLECQETIFKGGASFSSLQCEGTVHFKNAQFENSEQKIKFGHAGFGVIDCTATIFKGGASFNSLQCEKIGFFNNVQFENPEKKIDFCYAKFNGYLNCTGAIFKGGASFNSLQCEKIGFFNNVQFENPKKEISFGHAKFGTLECQNTIFKGGAIFNGLQCEKAGFFRSVQFENPEREINFVHATFCVNLECQRTTFAGKVDFKNVKISGTAAFWERTKFQDGVNFNGATIHNLSLTGPITSGSDSFPFEKDMDLRRCTFEIFEGTKGQQEHMVNAQSPEKFSQDPYLQFERYYRSIGDEAYAKKVYYDGRRALRKNALSGKNSDIQWPWCKKVNDWILCWMLGYGVKMWMPFIWILPLLCLGTAVFWPDNALVPKNAEGISAIKSVVEQIVKGDEAEQMGAKDNFFTHLGHRLWYSLDLFIPIVNLRIVDGYKRFYGWRAVYGVFHIVMGWILVPLLIASLSGVVKKYS